MYRTPPNIRTQLIAEGLAFVLAACQVPGMLRIALIGSLTTYTSNPKDADLLVIVTEDANLVPLARLGRKLQGRAMALGRGGEVFLADAQHTYLGRLCPWNVCAPGIRLRCDAFHCGRRASLHDDLNAIQLQSTLIAAPPVELWPEVLARVALPQDIVQGLMVPLMGRER